MSPAARLGWTLSPCLWLALGVAAAPPHAAPASPSAAFDESFRMLAREGLGLDPEQAKLRLDALEALLPEDDTGRRLAFEAIACAAPSRDIVAARARAAALLAAQRDTTDKASLARLHLCQFTLAPPFGDQSKSLAHIESALAMARRSGDPVLVGDILTTRGDARSLAGRHAQGLIDFVDAQALFEAAEDAFRMQRNLQAIGIAYRRMGEFDQAREHLARSLERSIESADREQEFVALLQLGFLYGETGDHDEQKRMLERAITLASRGGFEAEEGFALIGLAAAEVHRRQPAAALAAIARARDAFGRGGSEGDEPMLRLIEGQALAQMSRHAEALPLLDAAVEAWNPAGNERYLMLALASRSEVREATGNYRGALADLQRRWTLHIEDNRQRTEQRAELRRYEFELARRDAENWELRATEILRQRQIEALAEAQRWQWLAIGLGALLMIGLSALMVRQIVKSRRLRLLAMTDPLTGLANRRQTEYRGSKAFKSARALQQPFCVLAIDIDHFKQVNDTHGHAVGDAVLQQVGRECQRTLRKLDLIGRIGGEEFAGLLPETAEPAACLVAERLRQGVEALDLDGIAPGLRVTISIGVAQLRGGDADFAVLLARADAAMYRAKQAGRNRVVSDEAPVSA